MLVAQHNVHADCPKKSSLSLFFNCPEFWGEAVVCMVLIDHSGSQAG